MIHAIVPLKEIAHGKSRLATVLDRAERKALIHAMASDVLECLVAHPSIDTVTLLSPDPLARVLSERFGIAFVDEQLLDGTGINQKLAASLEALKPQERGALLVVHADLPLLSIDDVSLLIQRYEDSSGLVLACDRRGLGTNMLIQSSMDMPCFTFGLNSCRRHQARARLSGIPSSVLHCEGGALDVDLPEDLFCMLTEHLGNAGHTADWLNADGRREDLLDRCGAAMDLRSGRLQIHERSA